MVLQCKPSDAGFAKLLLPSCYCFIQLRHCSSEARTGSARPP